MSSLIRFGGLASGLDIDKIVSDLMKVERIKVDRLYQDRQMLEWQQEDYRDINSRLLSFKNTVFNMKLQSTIRKNTITVSDETIVTATAGASAREGNYTLQVNRLAEQAIKESGSSLSKALESSSLTTPINITSTNKEFKITLDGIQKDIILTEGSYNTLTDLKNEIQTKVDAAFGANQITVSVNVDKLTFEPSGDYKPQIILNSGTNDALGTLGFSDGASFKISTTASLKDVSAKFKYDPFASGDIIEFKVNGQTFSYDLSVGGADEGKSLASIISDINKNEAAGVEAYYDSITDRIVIRSKEYGLDAQVLVENIQGNLFGATGALQIDGNVDYGQNSEIVLDGITIIKSSNKFTIDGINYNLKKVSADVVNINVQRDIQGAYDAIKNFIDEYNSILDLINGKLTEDRYRDYKPLTQEQKDAMSDREVELWEEKARSGLLRNDSILSGIVSGMRTVMYSTVEGTGSSNNMLSEIGIKTIGYKEMGRLHIDESELMEALNNDIEGVIALFTQDSDVDDEKGIAVRLYDVVDNGIDRAIDKAGSATSFSSYDQSYLGKRIRDVNNRIEDMEEYLLTVEDRYWRQFTAMEKAISNMNAQSMWLNQQLMSMGK
jgi:flagellar hook-associated protein 2